jgi:hypothetical protein
MVMSDPEQVLDLDRRSGVSAWRDPSICERKATPSSLELAQLPTATSPG